MQEIDEQIYRELRRIADGLMTSERNDHTLTPTALVNEAWLRLNKDGYFNRPVEITYFYRSAAISMRRILIEHARKVGRRRSLLKNYLPPDEPSRTLLLGDSVCIEDVDECLHRFSTAYQEESQLVELRFFAGLTLQESANALGIPLSRANDHWRFARAWLMRDLRTVLNAGNQLRQE